MKTRPTYTKRKRERDRSIVTYDIRVQFTAFGVSKDAGIYQDGSHELQYHMTDITDR